MGKDIFRCKFLLCVHCWFYMYCSFRVHHRNSLQSEAHRVVFQLYEAFMVREFNKISLG